MASTAVALIVLGVFFWASFIICFSLLSMRLVTHCKKKHQIQSASKRAIGLSLVSMALFTASLFFYAAHFIVFVVHGKIIQIDFLNNFCYLAALFTVSYVWIQRLDDTFHNSVHGYSANYIRNLRRFWCVTLIWCLYTQIQHFIIAWLGLSNLKIYSMVSVLLSILLIVSLFITVLYSFIRVMKQVLALVERITSSNSTRVQQMQSIGNELLQLVVKYTILSVLCIGSTLFMCAFQVITTMIGCPSWHWMQWPLAVDDCIGFITLYCAWGNNKVYYTLFGCIHSMIIEYKEEPPTPAAPDMTDGDTICTSPGLSLVQSSDLHRPNSV
eukprot:412878_1